jgi:hypothetical protein
MIYIYIYHIMPVNDLDFQQNLVLNKNTILDMTCFVSFIFLYYFNSLIIEIIINLFQHHLLICLYY